METADVTLRVDFSGTPHPQQREDIRRAFDVMLDLLFRRSADSAVMAFNVGGAAMCRLYRENPGWIGRPTPCDVAPREGD